MDKNKIKKVLEEQKKDLLNKVNVVGLGICEKISEGIPTGRLALAVLVKEKVPIENLVGKDRIDPIIEGVETDVVSLPEARQRDEMDWVFLTDQLPGTSPRYPPKCP